MPYMVLHDVTIIYDFVNFKPQKVFIYICKYAKGDNLKTRKGKICQMGLN